MQKRDQSNEGESLDRMRQRSPPHRRRRINVETLSSSTGRYVPCHSGPESRLVRFDARFFAGESVDLVLEESYGRPYCFAENDVIGDPDFVPD